MDQSMILLLAGGLAVFGVLVLVVLMTKRTAYLGPVKEELQKEKMWLRRGEYNAAMVKGRQNLELLLKLVAEKNGIQLDNTAQAVANAKEEEERQSKNGRKKRGGHGKTKRVMTHQQFNRWLADNGYLDRVAKWEMNQVRLIGNKAVHENYADKDDAWNQYNYLEDILKTVTERSQNPNKHQERKGGEKKAEGTKHVKSVESTTAVVAAPEMKEQRKRKRKKKNGQKNSEQSGQRENQNVQKAQKGQSSESKAVKAIGQKPEAKASKGSQKSETKERKAAAQKPEAKASKGSQKSKTKEIKAVAQKPEGKSQKTQGAAKSVQAAAAELKGNVQKKQKPAKKAPQVKAEAVEEAAIVAAASETPEKAKSKRRRRRKKKPQNAEAVQVTSETQNNTGESDQVTSPNVQEEPTKPKKRRRRRKPQTSQSASNVVVPEDKNETV